MIYNVIKNPFHSCTAVFSDIEVSSTEVKRGTEAKITCTVTEIKVAMAISWTHSTQIGGSFISTWDEFEASKTSHTSVLTINPAAVLIDAAFSCTISSVQNPSSAARSFTLDMSVYGE